MENLHIFICHYNPLTERKTFILNELNNKIGNLLIKELECEFDNNVKEYKYEGFDENKTINYVYFIRKYDRQYLTKEIKDRMFLSCHDNQNNIRLEYSYVNNYQSNILDKENEIVSIKKEYGIEDSDIEQNIDSQIDDVHYEEE